MKTNIFLKLYACLIRISTPGKRLAYPVIGGLLFFCSCQQNGDFQEKDAWYQFSMSWYYVYGPVAYDVVIDDKFIGTLTQNGITQTVQDEDVASPLKHLQIKSPGDGQVLLDTTLSIRGGISLTQWFEDSPLCFGRVLFTETEPAPEDRSMCKYRFTYGDGNQIPNDSVKLVFFSGNDVYREYTFSAVDSVVVAKGEWSRWLTLSGNPKAYPSPVWLFKLYDAATGTLIQDISYKTTGSNRGFTNAIGFTNWIETGAQPEYKFRRMVFYGGQSGSKNGTYSFTQYEQGKYNVLW